MTEYPKLNQSFQNVIEIAIRLGLLIILVAWCFLIISPFKSIILWSVIIAIALAPVYTSLHKRLGNRPKLTALILILFGLAIIVLPGFLLFDSMIGEVRELRAEFLAGVLTIPAPDEKVASWPIIGNKLYNFWQLASENLENLLLKYQGQLKKIAEFLFNNIIGIGKGVVQFMVSIIIAGILLVIKGTDEVAGKFFAKLFGSRGDEFKDITIKTVSNVTKGILGVALIQSILTGLGFLFAGVPFAGIWALLVLVLAILQLPPSIITIPVIIYLFTALSPLTAVLWTIYLFVAGLSDNVLKPILLGKGAPVPMLVIFLGVIGGFILSGFIGLFTGAIVLSLGYKLLQAWMYGDQEMTQTQPRSQNRDTGTGA